MAKGRASVLLLLDKVDENLKLSLRNIGFLNFNLAQNANVYEVLANKKLVVTKGALAKLVERLKR